MSSKLRFLPFVIIAIISFFVYFHMFFYQEYIQWGNFGAPLRANLLNSLSILTWNPYSYNGIPAETPWISLFGNLSAPSLVLFGGLWNLDFAIKLFTVFSTFFMAYSFYLLSRCFVRTTLPRAIATIFIFLNPSTLQFIGQGDSFQFVFWGVYFLSLFMLYSHVKSTTGVKRNVSLLISALLLSLTVAVPQIFYLGLPLYIIFAFYFSIIDRDTFSRKDLNFFLKTISKSMFLIIMFVMPLILTTLFGAYNLSPSSSIANPLNNYIAYSANFLNLLRINAFPMLNNTILLGDVNSSLISVVWSSMLSVLVFIVMFSGLIFKDKRMLFIDLIIVCAAILGSGYSSPISSFNVFLYTHMLGYQVLNASYYWEWIIIIPLYAILISMMLQNILVSVHSRKGNTLTEPTSSSNKRFSSLKKKISKLFLIIKSRSPKLSLIIAIFLIFSVVTPPLIGQGFYGGGNSGIHQDNIPPSYNILINKLNKLVGNTDLGVAYFTPDNYVYFGNNTNGVTQPLLNDPGVRSPGVPSYLSPPVVSSNYFYWAYTEFYLNQTHSIAQLMGLMGIKYFVTLNNVISASTLYIANTKNPTELMKYQNDMHLLFANGNYSLFESNVSVNSAQSVKGFTIMSGNYETLLASAALGLNLSGIDPLFPGDIDQGNFNLYLNNTKGMVLLNKQSLTSVAIDRFANASNSLNPLDNINNFISSPSQGWISSSSLWNTNQPYIIDAAYPYAITSAGIPMSFTLHTGYSGRYNMWLQILNSPSVDAKLNVSINNHSYTVNSSVQNTDMGNFFWVKIPFNLTGGSLNISIKSILGANGLERAVMLKDGLVSEELASLNSSIKSGKISMLYIDGSGAIQLAETGNLPVVFLLHNTQNVSTGTYQQLLSIPAKYYDTLAYPNLSNVAWQYSNGTTIPSWLQSYNSTSSKWWLKIDNIDPSGNLTIYMVFYNKILGNLHSSTSGLEVFSEYNGTGLLGSGTGISYKANNVGFYFYAKYYDPTGKLGGAGLVGWNYDAGIDTPMFIGLSNTSYIQPHYFVKGASYTLRPKIPFDNYHLLGTALTYPEAYWFLNDSIIATANSTFFTNYSTTYVRPTGVNISVLYSFLTVLPPNNVMPEVSVGNLSNNEVTINYINSLCLGQVQLKVTNNPNGFSVSGNLSHISLVRYGYFSGMLETVTGFIEMPTMGGLSFIMVSSGVQHEAIFISVDYHLLMDGIYVFATTIIGSVIMIAVVYFRGKGRS